jgi:hypothetical protein
MRRDLRKFYFLLALAFLLDLPNITGAQENSKNIFLTNSEVVGLVRAGFSEEVILAKIKNSNCNFDTSTPALVTLKDKGVTSTVIAAMIDAKQNPQSESTAVSTIPLEIKNAVGKRKIYVQSEDERSLLEINKVLKEKGFTVVIDKKAAELYLNFAFQINRANIGYSPGIFGGVSMNSNAEQKNGKLTVYLIDGNKEHLVFVKERRPGMIGKLIHKQAEDYTEAFIKELKKTESSAK